MNTRLALLIAIFIGSATAACPPDFVASATIPGKCYNLTIRYYKFFAAIDYCRNNLTYGADILSIANEFENAEVASLLQPWGIPYAYIGNAFYDNEPHWIATAAGSSNYSNWGSDARNGYAARISSSGSWNRVDGHYTYPIICQIYPDDPTTFPPPQITCPAGWTPSISVRGKCYQQTFGADFFPATGLCQRTRIGDSHAELVTLTSQLEMMELSVMILYGRLAWANLMRWKPNGPWHWAKTLHPTNYFGPNGQPENDGGTCAALRNGNLYGRPCQGPVSTICQYFPYEPPGLFCPQNGIPSRTFPGTCYYVLDQAQNFQSARNACRALNAVFDYNDLFMPRTLDEFEEFEWIVSIQTPYSPVWLGLTSSNDGNWGWISGRSSKIASIWCSGEPNTSQNPNDQCAFVKYSNHHRDQICWRAGDCTKSHAVICQSSNTF